MGILTIRNRDGIRIPTDASVSLLTLLVRAGIAIPNRCGGHARCGFCRITFISGQERASAPSAAEEIFRRETELPPATRLACQTRLAGDAEIVIGQISGDAS